MGFTYSEVDPIDATEDKTSKNKIIASIDNNVNHEPKLSYADILIGKCGTHNPKDSDNMNYTSISSGMPNPYLLKAKMCLVLYNQRNESGSQMWQYIKPSE